MPDQDHDTYRRWLDLELDSPAGESNLAPAERSRLERHLDTCRECRRERADLELLAGRIDEARIEVRPGFRDEVMAGLPAAGWESRHPRSWVAALALFALLAAAAGWLVSGAGGLGAVGPVVGTVLAVADLLGSSALAGAGLLSASWRGIGLAIESALAGSALHLVAFAVGIAGLNYLFFRLLRHAGRRLEAVRRDRGE